MADDRNPNTPDQETDEIGRAEDENVTAASDDDDEFEDADDSDEDESDDIAGSE